VRGRVVRDARLHGATPRDADALRRDEINDVRLAVIGDLEAAIRDGDD